MIRYRDTDGIVYKPENSTILTILTLTFSSLGIGFSAIAVTLLILTAILFSQWRKIYKNQLLIQFMIARFLYTLVRYFYDLLISFDIHGKTQASMYIDLYLRLYTEMVLLTWMYIFTKQMYESLVKVFNVHNNSLWKVSLFSWLLPALLAGILYGAFYMQNNREFQIYLIYLALGKWPLLAAIAILLILTLKSVLELNKSRRNKNIRIVFVMIVLIFSFCLQQVIIDIYKVICIFVLFRSYTPDIVHITVVIFNIFSLYYCGFSILFWLFGNAHTRKLWKFQSNKLTAQNSLTGTSISK